VLEEAVGVTLGVRLKVGVTLGETEIVDEVEGVAPNDRDAVAVRETVGVIDDVPEKEAPRDIVGVVDGVPEDVLVAEFELVGDGLGVGAATKVKPVDDNV
jgi:hypothetical protein